MQRKRNLNNYLTSVNFKSKDLAIDSALLAEIPTRFWKEVTFLDKPYFIEVHDLDIGLEKRGKFITLPSVFKFNRNTKSSFTLSIHIEPSPIVCLLKEKGFTFVKRDDKDEECLTEKEKSVHFQESVIMLQIQKERGC